MKSSIDYFEIVELASKMGQDKVTFGKDIVRTITNDYENRICKYCKFYNNRGDMHQSVCEKDIYFGDGESLPASFGCNKFEEYL